MIYAAILVGVVLFGVAVCRERRRRIDYLAERQEFYRRLRDHGGFDA